MRGERKRRIQSTVVSLRISRDQTLALRRKARQLGRTPSETGAMLVDEGLRRSEFAFIDFRDTLAGRQAYVVGSRMAAWQVLSLVRAHGGRLEAAAEHLRWPLFKVQAAFNYANAFPDEMDAAISDNAVIDFAGLARQLPQAEEIVAKDKSATPA